MEIKENFSLQNYNTFGIEVKAKYFSQIFSEDGLKELLSLEKFLKMPKLILGGGSNILFTKDFSGLVINVSTNQINIVDEDANSILINASAGVVWHELVLYCIERNYGGIENLSLIPGKVGAAPIQNIGAYGEELKDTFYSLNGIFIHNLREKIFYKSECRFGYRDSIFKRELKNKFVITSITLKLSKHPVVNTSYGSIEEELRKRNIKEPTIKDISKIVSDIRLSKLPDPSVIGNAGSFFKNPEISKVKFEELRKNFPAPGYENPEGLIKIPAGWLIEQAGLKGIRSGNTGTHPKQALVIVNYGNATGEEILKFKDFIKVSIKNRFGIELQEEVNIV